MQTIVANPIYDSVFKYLMEDEPVVYVSRKYLDYDSNEITEGVPDPFVERLTHDSIIVQIPYLRNSARNHLDKVLCFFDQSYTMEDPHLVNLSDRDIEDNEEMRRIVTRLANAASIPEIRHTMNIEDEIFSELENLDTTVLVQKKKIIAQREQIAAQGEQIAAQGEQIAAAVRAFANHGIPSSEISKIMDLPLNSVEEILNHTK